MTIRPQIYLNVLGSARGSARSQPSGTSPHPDGPHSAGPRQVQSLQPNQCWLHSGADDRALRIRSAQLLQMVKKSGGLLLGVPGVPGKPND